MPTQSRGFFACDYCGLVCDTYEEARDHEMQCPQRPPGAGGRQPPPHGGPPPGYYRGGPPPPHYGGPGMHPEMEGYPPPPYGHGMSPGHPADHSPYSPYKTRCMPLLGPHERANMAVEDAIACQNIELFEATAEQVADHQQSDANTSGGGKQVGLRCVHCAKNPESRGSCIFPDSLGSIAVSVREIADNHLRGCNMAPPEIREACDRAASKRRDAAGGENAADAEEEEQSRMALLDYCVGFFQHLGVANKQPHKTGIEFTAENTEMGQHYGHPAETPNGPRGPPPNPYSGDRMGPPPMSAERYPGPAGPRHIGMMGAPGEGIAPTPLQRRRDRPGEVERPPPYSAESDRGRTPAGYPTPASYQGGPPGSERYPGSDGARMQTPAQPNFDGDSQAYPTPHSAHPSEGGSPGYHDLPSNFPFYEERDRTWHCKFCSHIHPQYRDPGSIWNQQGPPPGGFIDHHLSMCRAYHQSMPSPPMYQGPPPPYGPPMGYPYGPPGPWDGHSPTHAAPPGYPSHYEQYPPGDPSPYPMYPTYPPGEDPYGDSRARPGGHPMAPPGPPQRYDGGAMVPALRPPLAAPGGPPARKENMADSMRHAISLLVTRENEYFARDPEAAKLSRLVLDEDRLLLTEYFFFLMKQLRLCRFSESDRKTRGGKREKIKIGYGGLQCIHCADIPNSRKFFWSNVDRLANSFAEIPGHVLKCRRCPQQTKDALLSLKQYHPEQMARLPRGSQKVFFRRMWRRLHDEDPEHPEPATTPTGAEKSDAENVTPNEGGKIKGENSPLGAKATKIEESPLANASPETSLVPPRSAKEAAEALTLAAEQNQPLTPSQRVVLAIPEDKEWLSDMDCFIRKQLEVFCANQDDVETAQNDRKYPVFVGQVGIRCMHCSLTHGATGTAVAFPYAISQIYESVREFQRLHLDSCENLPAATKSKLATFKGSSSLSSVLRKYYQLAAKALGLQDTREGIRPGGESVPLSSQAAFKSFSDTGAPEQADAETDDKAGDRAVKDEPADGAPADESETVKKEDEEGQKEDQSAEKSDNLDSDDKAKPEKTDKDGEKKGESQAEDSKAAGGEQGEDTTDNKKDGEGALEETPSEKQADEAMKEESTAKTGKKDDEDKKEEATCTEKKDDEVTSAKKDEEIPEATTEKEDDQDKKDEDMLDAATDNEDEATTHKKDEETKEEAATETKYEEPKEDVSTETEDEETKEAASEMKVGEEEEPKEKASAVKEGDETNEESPAEPTAPTKPEEESKKRPETSASDEFDRPAKKSRSEGEGAGTIEEAST